MIIRFLFIGVALAAGALPAARAGVREFAEAHCFECHDTATHKAGLDLETLALTLAAKKNALTWESVFDRV